jgi:hypothetical protein
MKKKVVIVGIILESAILIGLLYKHVDLYDYDCSFILLLISPLLLIFHWFVLNKERKKRRLSKALQLKLFFLTGPAIILCLSLILSINFELKRIRLVGWSTKEMGMSLVKMAQNKDDNYPDSITQWVNYNIKKMKSDIVLYSIIFASLCLLYGCRYLSVHNCALEKKISENEKDLAN